MVWIAVCHDNAPWIDELLVNSCFIASLPCPAMICIWGNGKILTLRSQGVYCWRFIDYRMIHSCDFGAEIDPLITNFNYTCRYKERRWDSRKMLGSGGMPSSHSATVMALAVSIGLQEGVGASSFAIALVLACVVCTCQPGLLHILALHAFWCHYMHKASVLNFWSHTVIGDLRLPQISADEILLFMRIAYIFETWK